MIADTVALLALELVDNPETLEAAVQLEAAIPGNDDAKWAQVVERYLHEAHGAVRKAGGSALEVTVKGAKVVVDALVERFDIEPYSDFSAK